MDRKLIKQVVETKYLNVENTDRYRAIIRFLYMQLEQLKYWVQSEDIYEELKKYSYFDSYTPEQCSQDLDVLINWGNLKSIQDTKNFKTIEEYTNKRFRFQLTQQSIEIERMLIRLENMEIETFSLEPTLLEKIANGIRDIESISLEDLEKNFFWWNTLNKNFTTLNQNYRDYMKEFDNIKTMNLLDTSQFLVFKSSLVEYLRKFIKSLQQNSLLIEKYLQELDNNKIANLLENVVLYGISIPNTTKINEKLYREKIFNTWKNIKEWFIGNEVKEAETNKIANLTSEVIRKITTYALRISQSNSMSENRKKDYLKVASLFYECENISEAHKLSSYIFGISETFKLRFSFDRKTDDINSSVFEEEAAIIHLSSKNKVRREKQDRSYIIDNSQNKLNAEKELIDEIEMEKDLLNNFIVDNRLVFANLPVLEKKIRDKFLNWLFKAFENSDYKYVTEYGTSYKIENINPKEMCILKGNDGDIIMPSFILVFDN